MTKGDWGRILILALFASGVALFFMGEAAKAEKEISFVVLQRTMSVDNVILKTNKGDIEIEFFKDKAPLTVKNFITLVENGFYDGTKFHRVIEGFMIQGGDPFTKDDSKKDLWGQGGPGYTFADEIHDENRNDMGTIAMANAGPNTNGSQFFINLVDNNYLDTKHTVFGKIVSGRDTLMKILEIQTDERDRPIEPIVIEKAVLK